MRGPRQVCAGSHHAIILYVCLPFFYSTAADDTPSVCCPPYSLLTRSGCGSPRAIPGILFASSDSKYDPCTILFLLLTLYPVQELLPSQCCVHICLLREVVS